MTSKRRTTFSKRSKSVYYPQLYLKFRNRLVRERVYHQGPFVNVLLPTSTSSRWQERVREMAAQEKSPREAREPQERTTSGTATNIFKEMQSATKGSDVMTWKGKECLLVPIGTRLDREERGGTQVISS